MSETHPFNVHDLVGLKRMSDPQLSPDAVWLAFTVRCVDYPANKGRDVIYRQAMTDVDQPPEKWIDDASSPRWSTDAMQLYFLSSRSGSRQLWRVPRDEKKPVQVTHCPVDVDHFSLSPDGRYVALSMKVFPDADTPEATAERLHDQRQSKASGRLHDALMVRHWDRWNDGRLSQLFVADLTQPDSFHRVSNGVNGHIPSSPFGNASEWSFSADGRYIYFSARLAGNEEAWSTRFDLYCAPVDGSGAANNLTPNNAIWQGWPVPSADGKTLYYLAQKVPGYESDRFAVMAMDLATGDTREIAPDWDCSASHLTLSADGRTLYVTVPRQMQNPLFAIDIQTGQVRSLTQKGSVAGFSLAAECMVVAWHDIRHPVALYWLDSNQQLQPLADVNTQSLALMRRASMQPFDFVGAEGDRVHGYVVPPVDFEPGKKYPVAFIIHGGPQGVMGNGWSYRWNPQTYAGQGFAVVAINFHGSVGFGQAFTDSIAGHWGTRPLEDLKQGWDCALRTFPFLDGDRAAALGASFGGYMVYWLASQWQQPWRCLVSHDGVFDTRMLYYATEELWFAEHENHGPQYEVPEQYEQYNPVKHVGEWTKPMLVIHSALDFRIPLSQGLGAFTALKRQGIEAQLLTFDDENHWVRKPHNSVQWHQTVNAWLKRWLL